MATFLLIVIYIGYIGGEQRYDPVVESYNISFLVFLFRCGLTFYGFQKGIDTRIPSSSKM